MNFSILFFLLIIFFIPIPIKVNLKLIENKFILKIYNIVIFPIKKSKKPKAKSNKKSKKKSKHPFAKNLDANTIVKIIEDVSRNKFKPSLNFYFSLEYSLADASNTAISFGLINSINPIFYVIFYKFFKLKKFFINVKPLFKDKFIFNLEIQSIIYISLAQIICIIYLIFKNLLFKRR